MSKYKLFTFPEGLCDKTIFRHPKDKIVVVSVFGESALDDKGFKANIINEVLESTVFKMDDPPELDEDTLSLIEGYYDKSTQVLYLHLRSVEDTHYRCEALIKEKRSGIKKKFHIRDAEFRYHHARALLVLFSLSHIVILALARPTFSTNFIQLFRILEMNRQRAAPLLSELLREVPGISKEWINQLRPCTPRLLFYSDTCFIDVFKDHKESKPTSGQPSVIKRFEHDLEDHLYRVLRKTRIITNSSCNTLFTIPANQEFVFVRHFLPEMKDELLRKTESLAVICNLNQQEDTSNTPDKTHEGKPFLHQHIDLAFTKGFDDRVGRHASNAHFELTTAAVWVEACKLVYSFFMEDPIEQKHKQLMAQLYSCFDAPVRFSEARCKKVLPLAVGAYQESLPTHYTKSYHHSRVAHAVSVLAQHARGASSEKYMEQLQEECDRQA